MERKSEHCSLSSAARRFFLAYTTTRYYHDPLQPLDVHSGSDNLMRHANARLSRVVRSRSPRLHHPASEVPRGNRMIENV
jgi:hypothetical protein